MKRTIIFCFTMAALLALAAPSLAQDIPDLTGVWTVQDVTMHRQEDGFRANHSPQAAIEIIEQQGRVFHGVKRWVQNDQEHVETFSGLIAADGEIYIAEDEDGMSFGDLTGPDTMLIYYMVPGPGARVMTQELVRQ